MVVVMGGLEGWVAVEAVRVGGGRGGVGCHSTVTSEWSEGRA